MGNQDQTASRHRLVLVIKKGSRSGAWLRRLSAWGGFGAVRASGRLRPVFAGYGGAINNGRF
jgi:hypothetical protein